MTEMYNGQNVTNNQDEDISQSQLVYNNDNSSRHLKKAEEYNGPNIICVMMKMDIKNQ